MKKSVTLVAMTIAICFTATSHAALYPGPSGSYFVEPGSWTVGDSGSTYQAWDNFSGSTGNTPDAGYNTNPSIGTQPVVNVNFPGFRSGSSNFYSFSGPYSIEAEIENHGTGGSNGTHIIVQTAATMNGDPGAGGPASVFYSTLEIVDPNGVSLTGGDNGSALVNAGLLANGIVNSTFGPVSMEVRIWEFFLAGYTGDFNVQWDEIVHSSFDELRVDSLVTASALPATPFTFQQIPEPGTVVLAVLGMIGIVGTRRQKG